MQSTVLGTKPLPLHKIGNKIFILAEKNLVLKIKKMFL